MTHITHSKLIVCFLVSFGISVTVAPLASGAQTAASPPALTGALASAIVPATIVVSGQWFTPGGLVQIEVFDQWGGTLRATHWTTSSPAVHGVNGSQDPAQGFAAGGEIVETLPLSWPTIFGINGSQDPAQGFVAGLEAPTLATGSCDGPLVVRALDQRSASWSNRLGVEPAC